MDVDSDFEDFSGGELSSKHSGIEQAIYAQNYMHIVIRLE